MVAEGNKAKNSALQGLQMHFPFLLNNRFTPCAEAASGVRSCALYENSLRMTSYQKLYLRE